MAIAVGPVDLTLTTVAEDRLNETAAADGRFALLLGLQQQLPAAQTSPSTPVALPDLTVEPTTEPVPPSSAFPFKFTLPQQFSLPAGRPDSPEPLPRKVAEKRVQLGLTTAPPPLPQASDTIPALLQAGSSSATLPLVMVPPIVPSEPRLLPTATLSLVTSPPGRPAADETSGVARSSASSRRLSQLPSVPSPALAPPAAGPVLDPVTTLPAQPTSVGESGDKAQVTTAGERLSVVVGTLTATPATAGVRSLSRFADGAMQPALTTRKIVAQASVDTAPHAPVSPQSDRDALLGPSALRATSSPTIPAVPPAKSAGEQVTGRSVHDTALAVSEAATVAPPSRPLRLTATAREPAPPHPSVQAAGAVNASWHSDETPTQPEVVSESAESAAPRASVADQPGEVVRRLRLELTPPLLGHVLLDLRHEGGTVSAHAVVDQPATGQVLRQVEAQVHKALESQGLKVGGFEVSCRDGGQPRGDDAPARFSAPPTGRELPPVLETRKPDPAPPRAAEGAIDLYA